FGFAMSVLRHFMIFLAAVSAWHASPAFAEKELRMALISAPPSLGNPFGAIGPPSSFVWAAMFDPLVSPTDDGGLEPGLALKWEVITPTRWRFHLRNGIRFSNGEPFTAEAVAVTLGWLASDEGRRSVIGSEILALKGTEIVDDFTIDVLTTEPDAILPKRLTPVGIVAPKAWTELGPEGFAQNPAGTAAFKLESWTARGGRITLVANPNAWRKPIIDRITFSLTSDPVARVQSLMSGATDVGVMMGPENIGLFEGTSFQIFESPTPQVYAIAFNVEGRPNSIIADRRVRQAINYAVNKSAITDIIMNGRMRPAGQGATPSVFGYDPTIEPYPYDPERARSLLREAGVSTPVKLTADIVTNGLAGDATFLALVQQDLANVGIEYEIYSLPFAEWLRKYVVNSFDTDMTGLSWNGAPYYDAIRAASYFSCLKPVPFFCDREMMPLFDAARGEFDVEARGAILRELGHRMHDEAPALFLYEVTDLSIVAPRVRNFRVRTRVPAYEEIDMTEK
ncbi:MAG: ABC transporter substrate-binding protein, partial [Rhodobacteraceae bacterium]|nr:ABC transporter substrate-binding protein [Paracoccaceae bacterium]